LSIAAALGLAAVAPATGTAKQAHRTPDFTFKSKGTAVSPSAIGNPDDPASHEDFTFTIAPGDKDGTLNVHVEWQNPADDWDLYVYRKGTGGQLQTVGSSAGAPPSNEENAVADGQGLPMKAGTYVVRVVNYTATVPNFTGSVKFGPYTPYNQIPIARLKAPKHVKKGKAVKLDASRSHDRDKGHKLKDYAFDLDGNGSMEVDNGTNPILKRVLPPGVHHVGVRVTDDQGLRAFANRTVRVGGKKH
jgi:hypothetical protein